VIAALVCDGGPAGLVLGLKEGDTRPVVGFQPPAIGRVGLADVDRQELDAVA
jgi:hypothetical protein